MGNPPIILIGIVAGFWIVPFVARVNPVLVNGFLLLLLTGIVFGNADRWLPYLAAFGNAITGQVKRPTVHPSREREGVIGGV